MFNLGILHNLGFLFIYLLLFFVNINLEYYFIRIENSKNKIKSI